MLRPSALFKSLRIHAIFKATDSIMNFVFSVHQLWLKILKTLVVFVVSNQDILTLFSILFICGFGTVRK